MKPIRNLTLITSSFITCSVNHRIRTNGLLTIKIKDLFQSAHAAVPICLSRRGSISVDGSRSINRTCQHSRIRDGCMHEAFYFVYLQNSVGHIYPTELEVQPTFPSSFYYNYQALLIPMTRNFLFQDSYVHCTWRVTYLSNNAMVYSFLNKLCSYACVVITKGPPNHFFAGTQLHCESTVSHHIEYLNSQKFGHAYVNVGCLLVMLLYQFHQFHHVMMYIKADIQRT